jgi:hypothetical protein
MRKLVNIRLATDAFNYCNRLKHRVQIGRLNTGANKKNSFSTSLYDLGLWRDWSPKGNGLQCDCGQWPEKSENEVFTKNNYGN